MENEETFNNYETKFGSEILQKLVIQNPVIAKKDECIGTVYMFINNVTKKVYIGKTLSSYISRYNEHKYNAFTKKVKSYFYDSLRKHGWENFSKVIIFQTDLNTINNKDEIDKIICKKEEELIHLFKSNENNFGYNLTIGGEGISGYKFSEESKKKMSEMRKGEKHPNYGKFGKDNPTSVPVYQFDLDFNLVKEWDSIADIGRELNIKENNVCRCCSNKLVTYKGFIWVKKSDYYDGYLQKYKSRAKCKSNDKTIMQFSLEGKFIKEFISAAEAARELSCDASTISGAAKGRFPHGKYFIWIYKNDFSEELLEEKIKHLKCKK
jgi:hypothetical protein